MVCAHALQSLVHQKNKHITENKVYVAQYYTFAYKAHIMLGALW
jgi:hypothetical protein